MAKCRVCNRRLGPKHAAAGIGPICRKRIRGSDNAAGDVIKITFLSSPRTAVRDRRSWLYKRNDEPSCLIRVYPDPEGDGRSATCDCAKGKAKQKCDHITAVAAADKRRFYGEGN